jgi:hypothetical protein
VQERIEEELALVRSRFPGAEYCAEGHWIRVPSYALPDGWNRTATDVAFQVPVGYPGAPPYGIYVIAGLLFEGSRPDNYDEPAGGQPPFPGTWGIFSWTPIGGQWRPTADARNGSNLLNWVVAVADRFREGK